MNVTKVRHRINFWTGYTLGVVSAIVSVNLLVMAIRIFGK